MVSQKFLLVVLVAVVATVVIAEDAPAPTESGKSPKHVKKGLGAKGERPKFAVEKFKEIFDILENGEGSLEEKNKKVDTLAEKFSDKEKKVVEDIKKRFAKREETFNSLSEESKTAVKEIRDLRKKEHELFEKIDKKDKKAVIELLHPRPLRAASPAKGPKDQAKSKEHGKGKGKGPRGTTGVPPTTEV